MRGKMKSLLSTLIFKVNNALMLWKTSAWLTDPTKDFQNHLLLRQHLLQIVLLQDIELASPAQAGNDTTLFVNDRLKIVVWKCPMFILCPNILAYVHNLP